MVRIAGFDRLHQNDCMLRKRDLVERLVNFASCCIEISELLPKSNAAIHIAGQLARSASSPALQYGEAQAAESRQDFIHKMKICLKELRETFSNLSLVRAKKWVDDEKISAALKENNELIAIFVASINTAQKRKSEPD
jgi:four helix bundle protein